MDGTHEEKMAAKTMARDIYLVKTAQVAGEAFGHHAPADPEAAGWAGPTLGLLLLSFLVTAAYLAL